METNEGWPEAFGFSIVGDAPVMIKEVEESGSAQLAGLQIGDFLVELDGETVEKWSREAVIGLAQRSLKVPPNLVVLSHMRYFSIPRRLGEGFGVTFRGNSPVFIRSVDFDSYARSAGLRSGDLVVELNGRNTRYSMKVEVLELLKSTKSVLQLKVVARGFSPVHDSFMAETQRRWSGYGQQEEPVSSEVKIIRYEKAQLFHRKMDYYLMGSHLKKTQLLTLLRLYSKDRDIKSLGTSLNILLDSHMEKRLCLDIRVFIHPDHRDRFDSLVSLYPLSTTRVNHHWQGSLVWTRPLGTAERKPYVHSSMPDLSVSMERMAQVRRGNGSFGLALSGNAPVFICSVDKGGASEKAGLRSGDQLLQLNGINIRGATQSQVVQLLRNSGSHPTFVVLSPPPSPSASYMIDGYGMLGSHVTGARTNMTKKNVEAFKEKMEEVLNEEENQMVMKKLSQFSKHKEIAELVNSLSWVLDTPQKTVLLHYICQLLPDNAQREFDRIAAAILAGEHAVSLCTTGPLEGEVILSRDVRLPSSSLSAQLPYTESHVLTRGMAVASKEGGGGDKKSGNEGENQNGSGSIAIGQGGIGESDAGGMDRVANSSPRRENIVKRDEKVLSTNKHLQSLAQIPQSSITDASIVSSPQGGVSFSPNLPSILGSIVPPPPPPAFHGPTQSHFKRVNWEKIHGAEGTVWSELSGLEKALKYFDIEKFASQKPKGLIKKASKPSVLNEKKAYNISILLEHMKLSFDQIKRAVLTCDETVLSEQHLRQMETFVPDQKECLDFMKFYNDPSVLSKADRFTCEMSTIPSYQQRLRGMIFKLHFREKVDEIKPDLDAISKASNQLQVSKNFKKVLEILLAVGNYMNAGNHRVGGAIGFKISFLTQLKDLKTADNRSTLLHFVAATIERKFPQVMEFVEELSQTSAAARISGETLEVEFNELIKGLQEIKKTIEALSTQKDSPGDNFCDIMTIFVSWADKEMILMLKAYAHMKREYSSVLRFYGEDPSATWIDDFFSTFAVFISDFERAVKENRKSREKQIQLEIKVNKSEQATAEKGRFNLISRSSKNTEEKIKKEFEEMTKSKNIDIEGLENSWKTKAMGSTSKLQQDFRHLLKKMEPTRKETSRLSGEKGRSRNKSFTSEDNNTPKLPKVESRKTNRPIPLEVSELTGSWDYIPSSPTSTVELTMNEEDEGDKSQNTYVTNAITHKEEVKPLYNLHQGNHTKYGVWDNHPQPYNDSADEVEAYDDECDEDSNVMSSSPVLTLSGMNWKKSGNGEAGWKIINHGFDFETQF